jgi:uncharacterized membrane protein
MAMEGLLFALTLLAVLGSGLVALSAFVMAALRRLPAEDGIAAMQSINVTVLNPLFLTVFFGTAALSFALAIAALLRWSEPGAFYLSAGSLLYLLGTIFVTMAFNVPLNNRLAVMNPGSAEGASLLEALFVVLDWLESRTDGGIPCRICAVYSGPGPLSRKAATTGLVFAGASGDLVRAFLEVRTLLKGFVHLVSTLHVPSTGPVARPAFIGHVFVLSYAVCCVFRCFLARVSHRSLSPRRPL